MKNPIRTSVLTLAGTLLGASLLFGQARGNTVRQVLAPPSKPTYFIPPVYSYFYPSFGWYGGYFSPFVELPMLPPAGSYLPKGWWASYYPEADPRQAGYNPSAGYAWDSVGTLLLVTSPVKARVILDGVFVGASEYLGPIQLPGGEHSLRVEAAGHEPSETIVKVEEPVFQQLEIRLKPVGTPAKPAPSR